ncbi:MAG: cytochrome c biogenesis protein CcsA [Rickettsiales bacterium]
MSIKKLKLQNIWILFLSFIKNNIQVIFKCLLLNLIFFALIIAFLIYNSPYDYQQGIMVHMIYLHLPTAILSTLLYCIIAILALISLIYKNKIAYLISVSLCYIGSLYTFIAIFTGALWGRPIWGVFWQWEPRLISMLILFLFYISQILILNSVKNPLFVQKQFSILAIIGFINVPIIKFSVNFLSSIHQSSSIFNKSGIKIDYLILKPLIFSFIFFVIYLLLIFILQFFIYHKKFIFSKINF